MDSYEILGVTRETSDKDIEICFEDLKRKYDPSFNTSIRAYKKYRDILKAYEDIKNESSRKLYEFKDDNEIKEKEKKEYTLFDYSKEVKEVREVKVDYNNLEEVSELVREDIIINKRISYLYYLLNLKVDVTYFRDVLCDDCKQFVECDTCGGKGVVYYREKQVFCPKCHGKGEISCFCLKCNDEGVYKREENISLLVDNEVVVVKNLGNEYYDNSRSNVVINFDFYDKDSIDVKNDEIYVEYRLSKEETFNGFSREYYGENSAFKVEVPSFIDDNYKKEIVFNNKKIIFTFYNEEIRGTNKEYCLFINKKYKGQDIYFNSDYSKCSDISSEEYFNKVGLINKEIFIKGLGNKGRYNGENGDLYIKCVFNNKKDIDYISDVEVIETSKLFNLLGGKVNGIRHFGFKGEECLINYQNKKYLLSGNNCVKNKLKNYFLFKVISLLIWFLLPLVILFIPYNKMMFIIMIIVLGVYLVLDNLLMEVKV